MISVAQYGREYNYHRLSDLLVETEGIFRCTQHSTCLKRFHTLMWMWLPHQETPKSDQVEWIPHPTEHKPGLRQSPCRAAKSRWYDIPAAVHEIRRTHNRRWHVPSDLLEGWAKERQAASVTVKKLLCGDVPSPDSRQCLCFNLEGNWSNSGKICIRFAGLHS